MALPGALPIQARATALWPRTGRMSEEEPPPPLNRAQMRQSPNPRSRPRIAVLNRPEGGFFLWSMSATAEAAAVAAVARPAFRVLPRGL